MINQTIKNHSFSITNEDILDFLDISYGTNVLVPIACNNMDSFHHRFAKTIGNKYPQVKDNYGLLGKPFLQKNPGYTQFIVADTNKQQGSQLVICNMIVIDEHKKKSTRKLNYAYLCKSMINIKSYIKFNLKNPTHIRCDKSSLTQSGGNWSFIADLIEDIWYDIPVFVHDPKKKP